MDSFVIALLFTLTTFIFSVVLLLLIFKDKLKISRRINKLQNESNNKTTILERNKKIKKDRKLETKVIILKRIADELSLSGILIKPFEFLVIWAILILAPSSMVLIISRDFLISVTILCIGLFLPPFFVHIKKVKRVELFEQQLVDGIAIICNCLRSGLTFQQAIESISNEMQEPISKEFGRVVRELKFGNSIEKALTNMSDRLNSKDFMLIVSAVLIQRQVGGNLSDILSNIAGTIRERYKIKSEIKVLTTTGRTSGYVVGFMPIGILLLFMLINPSYVRLFFETTIGIVMLSIAAFLEIIGFLFIRKIVNIKY